MIGTVWIRGLFSLYCEQVGWKLNSNCVWKLYFCLWIKDDVLSSLVAFVVWEALGKSSFE